MLDGWWISHVVWQRHYVRHTTLTSLSIVSLLLSSCLLHTHTERCLISRCHTKRDRFLGGTPFFFVPTWTDPFRPLAHGTNVQSTNYHQWRTSSTPSLQVSNPHSDWLWSRRISTFSTSLAPCSSTRTTSTNVLGLTKLCFCRSSSHADIFQPTTWDCHQILRR